RGDAPAVAVHRGPAAVDLAGGGVAGEAGGGLGQHVRARGDGLGPQCLAVPGRRDLTRDHAAQVLLDPHAVADVEQRVVLADELDRPAVPGTAGGAGADDGAGCPAVVVLPVHGDLGGGEGVGGALVAGCRGVPDPEPVALAVHQDRAT